MKIIKYIQKFWILPIHERHAIIIACIYCCVFKLIIELLPFKYCNSIIRSKLLVIRRISNFNIDKYTIFKSIRNIEKIFPASCLTKSLIANALLDSIGIQNEIRIGLKYNENKEIFAHAYIWICESENFNYLNGYKYVFKLGN